MAVPSSPKTWLKREDGTAIYLIQTVVSNSHPHGLSQDKSLPGASSRGSGKGDQAPLAEVCQVAFSRGFGASKLPHNFANLQCVARSKSAENPLLTFVQVRRFGVTVADRGIITKQYRTKTGKDFGGKPWKGRAVYDLLTDQKYIGKIVHKGKAYDGEHAAIVKTDFFEKVQAVLRANKTYTHQHQVQRFALLRRMLRCGQCGSMIQPTWTNNHGRQYRYYTCSKRIKTGYSKCELPTLPAGEIETMVVDQLRALLRHPDVIARTYHEVRERAANGPMPDVTERLAELRQRRDQLQDAIRAVLSLGKQNGFMAEELRRLNGELQSVDRSIEQLEPQAVDSEPIELSEVTDTLQRIDPIWEVLHPEEQRRVLELLVETITVSKEKVDVRFRANGIEQVVEELKPLGAE